MAGARWSASCWGASPTTSFGTPPARSSRSGVAGRAGTPLKEAPRLMSPYGISGLPVIDEAGTVLGVVSEADFLIKGRGPEAARATRLERVLGRAAPANEARATAGG